ncbi:MAG: nitroreductase family protein [Candidatus Izemoplasma sp.]
MINTINKRKSIRNYQKKSLSEQDKTKVLKILEDAGNEIGPYNHSVKFFFSNNKNPEGKKIGTYGFIKNPPSFIGGVVKNNLKGMVDFGFIFEDVILKLTKEDVGTVWLGGTFTRSDFDVDCNEDEIIACVSPVGYAASSMSMKEKVIRKSVNANNRKPFDDLFFYGKEMNVVPSNHQFHKYLEAIRLAPSASNKQPWRVVIEDDIFHFYLKRTKGYGNVLKMDIQAVDIGIALSHLCLCLNDDEIIYNFVNKNPFEIDETEYIMSVAVMS